MAFKKGQSGNPKGRKIGSINRKSQLTSLLESYAEDLIKKAIELALSGDVIALRLCLERLIPKINREPINISLPTQIDESNFNIVKQKILQSSLNGELTLEEAEKLIMLLQKHTKAESITSINLATNDPVEAAKIYQRIMMET